MEHSMKQRILVVDDEAHIVQVLSLKLRNAGYEVLTASDGEEGLEVALDHRPDLIITDFHMPYMTGLELCRELAAHPNTATIPVLMLTARGYAMEPEDLAIAPPTPGAVPLIRAMLSKPFSPRAVVERIQQILGGQRTSTSESNVEPRANAA
jgi:two-component system, OmpR family, alkaline phosphatase synthesis response regulator PhoP